MMEAVVEEKVVEEPKVDTKPEWDKERQRADQAEANLRKSNSKLAEVELQANQMQNTVSELQGKMAQIEAVKGLDLTDLDPNEADLPDIVKEYAKMSTAMKDMTSKMTALEQKATQYESDAASTRQERERASDIERICKPLDKKYGQSLRNEAIRLAEEVVAERGFAAVDALECHQMLEKQYISLAKDASGKDKPAPSDNGRGGSKTSFGDDIKPGKLTDVMSQIRKGGLAALKKKD
jgi:chromosome segregation ATPase